MTKTLTIAALALLACLCAGCATQEGPKISDPELLWGCTALPSGHWIQLSHISRLAQVLRPLVPPHQKPISGTIKEAWFRSTSGAIAVCDYIDPATDSHSEAGCHAWQTVFKQEGRTWKAQEGARQCRLF